VKDHESDPEDGTILKENASKELAAVKMLQRNIIKMQDWYASAESTLVTANELLSEKIATDSLLNIH
jgi:hypothetical protein